MFLNRMLWVYWHTSSVFIYLEELWTYLVLTDTPRPASCGRNPSGIFSWGGHRSPPPRSPRPPWIPAPRPSTFFYRCRNLIPNLCKKLGGSQLKRESKHQINCVAQTAVFEGWLWDNCGWLLFLLLCGSVRKCVICCSTVKIINIP